MDNLYEIVIGDWSDDGHSKKEHFLYISNKDLFEAYQKAKEEHPKEVHPNKIFDEYGADAIEMELADQILDTFPELEESHFRWYRDEDKGTATCESELLAYYVIVFCRSVEPDLEAEKIFPGKVTHDHIGYGLY